MIGVLLTRTTDFKGVDTAFIGRKTYEMTWTMGDNGSGGFPKLKEYIFSTTPGKVKDGATLIKSNIKIAVENIKKEKGKDIWLFGGAGLTTSLLNLGLVDELSLAVHPVLPGRGKPFNNINDRIKLTLADTKTYSTGLVSLTYNIGPK